MFRFFFSSSEMSSSKGVGTISLNSSHVLLPLGFCSLDSSVFSSDVSSSSPPPFTFFLPPVCSGASSSLSSSPLSSSLSSSSSSSSFLPFFPFKTFLTDFLADDLASSSSFPKPASLIAPSISPWALFTSPIAVVFFEINCCNSSSESYSSSPIAFLPGILLISGTSNILSISRK